MIDLTIGFALTLVTYEDIERCSWVYEVLVEMTKEI